MTFLTEIPVIQAPMAGAQGSVLAIAVSNADGLGSLPCGMLTPQAIRAELSTIAAATGKPYNVNFFVHREPAVDDAREAAWRAILAPYYRELGADPSAIPAQAGRTRFDEDTAAVLEAFRPPVVSFHFGLPAAGLLRRVKGWGSRVIASATTIDEARHLEAQGVDAIIAQGLEAGGHRGMFLTEDLSTQMGTFALVRQLVQAVRVPVIAAGGIADAAGVRAALAWRHRRAGWDGLPLLSGGDDQRGASWCAEGLGLRPHCADQSLHRPARARPPQPTDAGDRADERRGAGVSPGVRRNHAAAGEGGGQRQRRLHRDVGWTAHPPGHGPAGGTTDAGAGRIGVTAAAVRHRAREWWIRYM